MRKLILGSKKVPTKGTKQEKFIKLYDEHIAAIYRYVFLRVNSREMAQDLTSEVFLKAWSFLTASSQKIENPKAFFYRIARNLVIDFYRSKSRAEISLEETQIQIPDIDNSPEEKINLSLEMVPIQQALNQIKDDYRDVIIWHYLDELTIPEIADILGKTENATRVMLSRGLQQIREKVKNRLGTD